MRRGRSGAWSRWLRGVRGVRGQQRRVGLGRDAGVTASKLRCDEGLGGETQQGICYLGVHLQWRVQPVHRGEQGGQRACVRLAKEGGVQGCRGDSVQEASAVLESTEEVSTADCRA